jgi:hypothetical protein
MFRHLISCGIAADLLSVHRRFSYAQPSFSPDNPGKLFDQMFSVGAYGACSATNASRRL